MSNHRWRQGYGIDPFREWVRRELPGSSNGFVISDIDYGVRLYGDNFGLDEDGDLMLIEKKEFSGDVTIGQRRMFRWVKDAVKDETGQYEKRFRGIHLIQVKYTEEIPCCESCGAPDMSRDDAYNLFMSAKLAWDRDSVTHEELRKILLREKALDE